MRAFIAYDPPIPPSDLLNIQAMLAKDQIFSTVFPPDQFDTYSLTSFIGQKELYGNDVYALLDRNIFTRIVSLARGECISSKPEEAQYAYRLAAGAIAFLQCCNALIEPCVPFYEQAHQESPFSTAAEELDLFRKADNIHPRHFAEIAVGRADKLDQKTIQTVACASNEEREAVDTPQWWLLNYALALKLALLELSSATQRAKLESFLSWVHEEFTWLSPSVLFAVIYLGPKRKHGMLKRLRSKDRQQALKGIKNATWDLTLLTMWCAECGRLHGRNKICVLCSRDEVVQLIGASLMTTNNDSEQKCRQLYVDHWGERDGLALHEFYKDLARKIDDPIRRMKRLPKEDLFWNRAFKELEGDFLRLSVS